MAKGLNEKRPLSFCLKSGLLLLLLLLPLFPARGGAQSRMVTDAFGRTVEVPEKVESLIALGSAMAFVTYLGAQNLAVAVEDIDKTGLTKPYMIINRDLARDLPVAGKAGAVRIPDYERIISLKPDVIFLLCVDAAEPDSLQRKLRIPVVAVSQGLPDFNEESFLQSIRIVGEALDRNERAGELIRGIRSLAGELSYRPEEQDKVRAYVGGLSYKGNQGINSTAGDFLPFSLAGIENVADSAGRKGHFFVNKEFLLHANPPLLFIDGNGLPLIREDIKTSRGYYARLRALQSGNAWLLLPHTSYFDNPELLYINAFFMAKAAYPEHYVHMDPAARADEIFILFNGGPLYERYVELTGAFRRLVLEADGSIGERAE